MQVPLLLSLGEMEGALTKAIDSGDTDLVYLAIFRLAQLHAPSLHNSAAFAQQPVAMLCLLWCDALKRGKYKCMMVVSWQVS